MYVCIQEKEVLVYCNGSALVEAGLEPDNMSCALLVTPIRLFDDESSHNELTGTRPHMSRNSTDATENTSKHMRPQEGNADYSPFSYSSTLAPDQQHSQHSSHSEGRTVDPNQSFNGALLDQTNMYDWSLVDWTAPLLSLSGDMSDFSNAVT